MASNSFIFTIFQLLISSSYITSLAQQEARQQNELVPAMFIFGDSLIDNGNNNNLPSLAKANYFPYGIDFSGGPSGRFSNGYTIVDELGSYPSNFFKA